MTVPGTDAFAQARTYLMCPPRYFGVSYAINPWMHPDRPVDAALAMTQWAALRATFARLGHRVHVIDPVPGLPDMVFAANGAAVIDGKVIEDLFGLPVLSLRLVDPRYYHLDTALCVLDSSTVAYYPAAFDDAGRAALASRFTELIEAKDEDAEVLGLNAISDGRHVVLPTQARGLAGQIAARGFEPVPVNVSELSKAGGGPKCCTLKLRTAREESL
jgi:N-dimethylarginine dimethylaminohydrolase